MQNAKSPIRIGVSPWSPSVNPCILHVNRRSVCQPGIEIEILLTLLNQIGIETFSVFDSRERGCGDLELNDAGEIIKVSGLMAMLLNGTIDITGSLCTIQPSRLQLFDTTWPIINAKQAFVIKAPKIMLSEPSLFAPISNTVWFLVLGVFIAMLILNSLRDCLILAESKVHKAVVYWTWELLTYAFDLDSSVHPNKRLLYLKTIIPWMLCYAGIRQFYACEVLSATSSPRTQRIPFDSSTSLAPMIEQGSYTFVNHVPRKPKLSAWRNATVQQFNNGMKKFGHIYENSSVYSALLTNENWVYPTFDIFVEQTWFDIPFRDELMVINDKDDSMTSYAYLLAKGSKINKELNFALSYGYDLVKLTRKRYLGKSHLEAVQQQRLEPLSLFKALTAFRTLGISWTLATLVFLFEIIYFRTRFQIFRKSGIYIVQAQ